MKLAVLLITFFSILFGYLFYMKYRKEHLSEEEPTPVPEEDKPQTPQDDGECCGQHEVCERDLLISSKIKADYYDDEELDDYAGREPSSYSSEETKQFEEVFYTLKEYDVSGWLRSLQLRGITPPDHIKEEALFIVQERRFKK